MNARQPKSRATTIIEVVERPGGKKGHLELTSGNINYFRAGAKVETLSITYQQLLAMLERELEYQAIDTEKVKFPKPHKQGDFTLVVRELDEEGEWASLIDARSSINKLDPRRVASGTCQFSDDIANGKPTKKYHWVAEISIQASLWIINQYIDKFLVAKKMSDHTDDDVVVSKQKMREVLLVLLKKVDA